MRTILYNTMKPFFAVMLLLITNTSFGQTWSDASPMSTARSGHTATLLPKGKVLVAGGDAGKTCELYDPASGNWTTTSSSLTFRLYSTATLLPNGKVLVTGGYDLSNVLKSCEIYDPVSGIWSSTTDMAEPREYHTATLLPNGKVLVAGGYDLSNALKTCEIYDPVSGTWSSATSMILGRSSHTATLMADGNILMVGGNGGGAELYNPATGTLNVSYTIESRSSHTATVLPDGKVLITGGRGTFGVLSTCELYDPASGSWSSTGSMQYRHQYHTATLLSNNQVLVAGGMDLNASRFAEFYNITSGIWTTVLMGPSRYKHTATLLPDNNVLLAGGTDDNGPLNTCRLYSPGSGPFPVVATAGPHGTIIPADTTYVPSGNSITYTITPDSGYQIAAESIDNPSSFDSSQTSPSYTFNNVQFSHTIAALFMRSAFTLSYNVQANGSIGGLNMQTINYHANGSAVTAVPDPGYYFISWSDGSIANPRTDSNIVSDLFVTASFAVIINSLTTIATGHGKISGRISFTADTGYHVTNVQIDGSSAGPVTSYTFSNLAANHTINVNFDINTYTATASPGSNGTINPAGVTTVNYGSSLTYNIIPKTGYHITAVVADGVPAGIVSGYTFTNITRNHSIKATFAINIYTIVSSAGTNGTITPTGSATVNYGTTKKYTVKANSGYHIADVLVDNISVGAVGTYTFTSISGNHTISVSFAGNNALMSMAVMAKQVEDNAWTLWARPNPAKNNVSVAFTVAKKGDYFIKLTSLSGRVLIVQKVSALAGANMIELNVSNYAKGNYFITLTEGSKAKTISIIKAQ